MNQDNLDSIFVEWSLLDWWDTLLQAYKEKGFTDELNDEMRIKEFTEITKRMNNWVNKAKNVVVPYYPYNLDEGTEAFLRMSEKLALTSRVNIIYAMIRNNWHEMAHAKLMNMLIDEAQAWAQEEEGSDDNGRRDHYEF